jgi:hypothetical protein
MLLMNCYQWKKKNESSCTCKQIMIRKMIMNKMISKKLIKKKMIVGCDSGMINWWQPPFERLACCILLWSRHCDNKENKETFFLCAAGQSRGTDAHVSM